MQEILLLLQESSGKEVGKSKTIKEAEEREKNIEEKLILKISETVDLEKTIASLTLLSAKLESEIVDMEKENIKFSSTIKKEEFRMEEFWQKDQSQSKQKFEKACKNLEKFKGTNITLFSISFNFDFFSIF